MYSVSKLIGKVEKDRSFNFESEVSNVEMNANIFTAIYSDLCFIKKYFF